MSEPTTEEIKAKIVEKQKERRKGIKDKIESFSADSDGIEKILSADNGKFIDEIINLLDNDKNDKEYRDKEYSEIVEYFFPKVSDTLKDIKSEIKKTGKSDKELKKLNHLQTLLSKKVLTVKQLRDKVRKEYNIGSDKPITSKESLKRIFGNVDTKQFTGGGGGGEKFEVRVDDSVTENNNLGEEQEREVNVSFFVKKINLENKGAIDVFQTVYKEQQEQGIETKKEPGKKEGFLRLNKELSEEEELPFPKIYSINENSDGEVEVKMEYVKGKPLNKYINDLLSGDGLEGKNIEKDKYTHFKDITKKLLQAMEKMHNLGMIYCDIKPENIIVTDKGVVKFIDLDSAEEILLGNPRREKGKIPYTSGYVSPEQVNIIHREGEVGTAGFVGQVGEGGLTAKTDMYSLGASLYEILLDEKFMSNIYQEVWSISNPVEPSEKLEEKREKIKEKLGLNNLSNPVVPSKKMEENREKIEEKLDLNKQKVDNIIYMLSKMMARDSEKRVSDREAITLLDNLDSVNKETK